MAKKKKHHYIPQFYLKGFVDPNNDPLIWIYRKGDERILSLPSQSIGFENHYYSFTTNAGEKDSETIENFFAHVEGAASGVFKQLRDLELPNEEEHRTFTTFLALLLLRVPTFRNQMEDGAKQLFTILNKERVGNLESFKRDIDRYEYETGEIVDIPAEELQKTILEDKLELVVSPEFSLSMISIVEDVEQILGGMHWTYLKATEEVKFLSSDNPLTYNHPTYKPGSFFGVGLANENTEVTFPISKDLACLGTWKSKLKKSFLQANSALIKETNRRTVRGATREVYASRKSEAIFRLVQKYKDSAPKVHVG